PEHHPAEPNAPPVTDANLLASDRFWPYQVELLQSARAELPGGSVGVLIRVEDGGMARIDFGRDGLHDVRIDQTDLVLRANRVRSGELEKIAPNFVLALGPRLLDPSTDVLKPLSLGVSSAKPGFLCVFADPSAKSFAALAAALAPLRDRDGVLTIVFPQAEQTDAVMRERLRELDWDVPFVYDHLSEPYTRTLLSRGVRAPAVQLQTRDGRVLFESAWRANLVPELTRALDRAFKAVPASSAAAGSE
ncbi:MAG: hypothetical protein ACREJT_15205, partial [Myxococcota bacterium]